MKTLKALVAAMAFGSVLLSSLPALAGDDWVVKTLQEERLRVVIKILDLQTRKQVRTPDMMREYNALHLIDLAIGRARQGDENGLLCGDEKNPSVEINGKCILRTPSTYGGRNSAKSDELLVQNTEAPGSRPKVGTAQN